LPEVFVQNASLEIAWTRVVLEGRTIAGETIIPFVTDEVEGFDINDQWDWWMAEEMLRGGLCSLPPVGHVPYPFVETPRHG
jgi:CMP-N-acetylneuraminic acid synthetase